jgi:hypothetical protein
MEPIPTDLEWIRGFAIRSDSDFDSIRWNDGRSVGELTRFTIA